MPSTRVLKSASLLRRLGAIGCTALALSASASASPPDLTLTQSSYDACLANANNTLAQVTVTMGQTTLAGPTHDLDAIYAALASTPSSDGVVVNSNSVGSQSLYDAQVCLAPAVPTLGVARLHEVRPDLQCGTNLLVDGQISFNSTISPDLPWVTFLPDGISTPECGEKLHVLTYELQNGDFAGVFLTMNDEEDPEKNKVTAICTNTGGCDNAQTNMCRVSGDGDGEGVPIRCMCGETGPPNNGCLGDSKKETSETTAVCPSSIF